MTIQEQINELRKKHGVTMQKLADDTAINRSNVSKILRCKITPTINTACILAHALGYELKLTPKKDEKI